MERRLTEAQKRMIMMVWNNPNYSLGPVGGYGHRCYNMLVQRGLIIEDDHGWGWSDRAMGYIRSTYSEAT